MKLALVYDLKDDYRKLGFSAEQIAEFDSEVTIGALETALTRMGFEVERVGRVQSLVAALAKGKRWDIVFNIAEGLYGTGREATVPALLDAYQIPYVFSGPVTMASTLDKAIAKHLVHAASVPTANFTVVSKQEDVASVKLPFPLFVKPLAEGTGKGVDAASHVETHEALAVSCHELLNRFHQPVLVETFLPGREFTVGVIGTGKDARAIGVLEVALRANAEPFGHSYANKADWQQRVDYHLATDAEAIRAEEVALAAWRALGCQDGGRVDLRSDASGTPHFLEANPLAGLNPDDSDLCILAYQAGMDYDGLIYAIMEAAAARLGLTMPNRKPKLQAIPASSATRRSSVNAS